MKKILLTALFAIFLSTNVFAVEQDGVDPSYVYIQVHKFSVAVHPDCSNPITVYDGSADPKYENMSEVPTLGRGTLADGTYKCVIMRIGSVVMFGASADSGADCQAGKDYSIDVCQSGLTSTLVDGTTVSCVTNQNDVVDLYISTASSADTGNSGCFKPPTATDNTRGIRLLSPLVVKGEAVGQFVLYTKGRVGSTADGSVDGDGQCDMAQPVFMFRN